MHELFVAAKARVTDEVSRDLATTPDGIGEHVVAAVLREVQSAAAQPDLLARLLLLAYDVIIRARNSGVQAGSTAASTAGFCALREYPNHAGVVAGAFSVLASVAPALSRADTAALLREAVQTLACDDANSVRSKCGVAYYATVALNNAVANNPPNKQSAIILGAVAAIATAMGRYVDEEKLQTAGCMALHALGGREMLPNAGIALDAVLSAMRAFPDAADLQKNGGLALSSVLKSNNALQADCARAGGLQLMAATLRRHVGDAEVCEAVCLGMNNMHMWQPACAHAVPAAVALTALQSVVAALCAHTAHAPTQEFGIHALGQLCGLPEVARHAASLHVFHAIVGGMSAHPNNVCVQTVGCMAFSCICRKGQPPNRAAAVEAGAIPALVRALRTSYSRTALRSGAADHEMRYGYRRDNSDSPGPNAFAIAGLCCLYEHHGDPSNADAAPGELLSGVPALHEGVMAVLHRVKCADGSVAEKRRMELVKEFTASAILHGIACPDCSDCDALRARGELCGLKTCTMSTPFRPDFSDRGETPVLSAGSMKLCARCKTVAYCSLEHQREDWRVHKPACTALCSRRAAA